MNEPHLIVLFGVTGDLARRKLLPGVMHLVPTQMVPDSRIIGVSLDEFVAKLSYVNERNSQDLWIGVSRDLLITS